MAVEGSVAAARDAAGEAETWIDREVAAREFRDSRLREMFRKLLGQMGGGVARQSPWRARTGRAPRLRIAFPNGLSPAPAS